MKLLAVSDMHGDLTNVFSALDTCTPDAVISCGDWGDPGEVDHEAFERLLERVAVFTVYGNHDDIDYLQSLKNRDGSSVLLQSGELVEWGGLRLAGINGIWAKSHAKGHYVGDEEVAANASALKGKRVDILLTHGCPVGTADSLPNGRHGGQKCFQDAYRIIAPRLYLCGHLHFAQEHVLKDGRMIINVGYTCEGDYWVIDIDRDAIVVERGNISVK
ncbi:MAG TPA: metallophosphoesterase [Armatimonadota bacterium]|jgi:Icc-related predicted phosphoesterase